MKVIRETNNITNDILTHRIGGYLKDITQTCMVPLPRRPAQGSAGDQSAAAGKKSNVADDCERNRALTSHEERLYSFYLE